MNQRKSIVIILITVLIGALQLLSQHAARPPQYNPFTVEGNRAWEEWAEGCREIERQLVAEGVKL